MRLIASGTSTTRTHVVTAADVAAFDGTVVHPVYGTACVVRDMEHVARLALLPLLEDGEAGAGREVLCRHLAPVPVGEAVEFTAVVTGQSSRALTCAVQARCRGRLVAEGHVVQAVVDPLTFLPTPRDPSRRGTDHHDI